MIDSYTQNGTLIPVQLTRKQKPDWFSLIDKIKAIREMDMGSNVELGQYVKAKHQRVMEWITGSREAKAQTALNMQDWVHSKEEDFVYRDWKRYKKICERLLRENP